MNFIMFGIFMVAVVVFLTVGVPIVLVYLACSILFIILAQIINDKVKNNLAFLGIVFVVAASVCSYLMIDSFIASKDVSQIEGIEKGIVNIMPLICAVFTLMVGVNIFNKRLNNLKINTNNKLIKELL